jgi:two-component system cell cycle response regulator CpdR
MVSAPVVLVVDDDPGVRQMLIHALEADGMTVVGAASGREALRILQCDPTVTVLVSDIMMPGITGITLAAEAVKLRPDVKTLLMTAYAPADLTRSPGSVLTKPVRISDLYTSIRTLIDAS